MRKPTKLTKRKAVEALLENQRRFAGGLPAFPTVSVDDLVAVTPRKPIRAKTVAIPISAAARIAKAYGYDQVYIIGRKVGEGGSEHLTTYGINREHCAVAARAGEVLMRFMEGTKP
jgi:hypothetical protein